MKKQLIAGAALLACSVMSLSAQAKKVGKVISEFGLITDIHFTDKADSETRKYSAAMDKLDVFITEMNKEKPNFVIELGDMVDTLKPETDAVANLRKIESLFKSFKGPSYHVLGNHEFDNLTRKQFLDNITNTNIPDGETYYSWTSGGVHYVVLDADYTVTPEHRPYDMKTKNDNFWTWKDAYIPDEEKEWFKNDLASTDLPVVVFTHQPLDRIDSQDHNVKNATEIRDIMEADGDVLTVISGHDHAGGYSQINGIHYIVFSGNVGVSDERSWSETSPETNGMDKVVDNQYAHISVCKGSNKKEFVLVINGKGHLPSYTLTCTTK